MSTEYKLSYTATEIDERLGMVDSMVKTVNGVSPDESGNAEIAVGVTDYNQLDNIPCGEVMGDTFYLTPTTSKGMQAGPFSGGVLIDENVTKTMLENHTYSIMTADGVEWQSCYFYEDEDLPTVLWCDDCSGYAYLITEITEYNGNTYPCGLYLSVNNARSFTIHGYGKFTSVKPIDTMYIPVAKTVPNAAGETPTAAEFNALLISLRNAGYLAT